MKTLRTIALLATMAVSLASTAQTTLQPFTGIKVFGKMEVSVKIGQEPSIKIDANPQSKEKISYKVVNDQLHINNSATYNIVVIVSCPSVNHIELGGGAKLFNSGTIKSDSLHLEAGAGTELDLLVECDSIYSKIARKGFVRLTGKARALELKTTTGGTLSSEELENDILYANMEDGFARTKASSIIADIAPWAKIYYIGTPTIIRKDDSKGQIIPDEE